MYRELESLDKFLLLLWKLFEYSSVRCAVFENAQIVDGLKPLKILKACTTRSLTHGETSARVISRFKQVIATLDALTSEKRDEGAKSIIDQMLSPMSILMLLLLAEVLVPINDFCRFLQTRSLKYSLIISKFQRVVAKLDKIKENIPNYDAVDISFRCFQLASDLLKFSKITSSKVKSHRSRVEHRLPNDQCINKFIAQVGYPLITDLIVEIEDAMKETSPVLSGFDLFNPETLDKSRENRKDLLKTLCDHDGISVNDSYEGQVTTAIPALNPVHAASELEDFIEAFDDGVNFLNEKLKKSAKQLCSERNLNEAKTSIETKKPTSTDFYMYLASDGSLKQFPNIATLFKTSLLIPPTTSNVERGFLVMNLICTPLRPSLSEFNQDRFMHICINGPETFSESDVEKMVDIFKKINDSRHLDL